MGKFHIALAVVIFTVAPGLAATFNDGVAPGWTVGLAITGLVIAAVVFFIPTRKDVDL